MTMKSKKQNGICKISLAGELTIYQAGEVYEKLRKQFSSCECMEIDLHEITELDTAGVQILLSLKEAANVESKKISLSLHSEAVIEVFELLNIAHEFGDPIVLSHNGSA